MWYPLGFSFSFCHVLWAGSWHQPGRFLGLALKRNALEEGELFLNRHEGLRSIFFLPSLLRLFPPQSVWRMPCPVPCSRPCWPCATGSGRFSASSSSNAPRGTWRPAVPLREWGPRLLHRLSPSCCPLLTRRDTPRNRCLFFHSFQSPSGLSQGPGLQPPRWDHHTAVPQVSPPGPLQEPLQGSAGGLGPPCHRQLPRAEAHGGRGQTQNGWSSCLHCVTRCRINVQLFLTQGQCLSLSLSPLPLFSPQFLGLFDELIEGIEAILAAGHMGVIVQLAESCAECEEKQDALMQCLLRVSVRACLHPHGS